MARAGPSRYRGPAALPVSSLSRALSFMSKLIFLGTKMVRAEDVLQLLSIVPCVCVCVCMRRTSVGFSGAESYCYCIFRGGPKCKCLLCVLLVVVVILACQLSVNISRVLMLPISFQRTLPTFFLNRNSFHDVRYILRGQKIMDNFKTSVVILDAYVHKRTGHILH